MLGLGNPTWRSDNSHSNRKWRAKLANEKSYPGIVRKLASLTTPDLESRMRAAQNHLKELQMYIVLLDKALEEHHPKHRSDCLCPTCDQKKD